MHITKRIGYSARAHEAYDLYESGLTYREIGEKFGVTGGRARQLTLKHERLLNRIERESPRFAR